MIAHKATRCNPFYLTLVSKQACSYPVSSSNQLCNVATLEEAVVFVSRFSLSLEIPTAIKRFTLQKADDDEGAYCI